MAPIDVSERNALRETFARFLADRCTQAHVRAIMATDNAYDPEIWSAMAELGILATLVPQDHDGLVPVGYLLSQEGTGWKVIQTALAYERLIMGEGAAERRFDQQDSDNRPDLIALAKRYGRLQDPCLRQEIAQAIAWRRLNELNCERGKVALESAEASPLMSLTKLAHPPQRRARDARHHRRGRSA